MIDAQAVLLPIAIFASMIGIGVELELRQFRVVVEKPLIPVLGTLVHTLTFPVLDFVHFNCEPLQLVGLFTNSLEVTCNALF